MVGTSEVAFPASAAARDRWFPDDLACLAYLDALRWRHGFRCPRCGGERSWVLPDGRRSCAGCATRTSPTAGTLLHRARSPLPVWFAAAWEVTAPGGTTTQGLQRAVGLSSSQTAWAMLTRLRLAMGGAGARRLVGPVEVAAVALPDRVVADRPIGPVVAVAVERSATGPGRFRLEVVPADGHVDLPAFVAGAVGPGAVVTAGQAGPGAVAAGVGAWLGEGRHGAVRSEHLQAYLDEAAFRSDPGDLAVPGRRFRRLLAAVVATGPVPASALVGRPVPRPTRPAPPPARRLPPPRSGAAARDRPWWATQREGGGALRG